MRYAVIDLETTGFNPREDRVVEMACVLVECGGIVETWSTLVDPARPIPPYATRVHGITDEDVVDAPPFEIARRELWRRCIGSTIAAHNASFDLGFLPELAHLPSVCTLQLARRWFPNAPNHKNQTLRAYLNIDEDLRRLCGGATYAAHRALGDALVTAAVLIRCLQRYEGLRSA
jgi:DNA polymerase III epsilon subunit-like protein